MNEFKLGTYIKKRRTELGMSQEELCSGLCAVSSLSRIENNQQDPSRALTMNLLERLGLPHGKFAALWGQNDITIATLRREITDSMIQYHRASEESRHPIAQQILEKLDELERIANAENLNIQQFLLMYRARLGPYSVDERLAMQLKAIRLTCPDFDLDDFQRGHYNMDESRLINQIANTYTDAGQRKKAINIYRQLLWNLDKYCREFFDYANHFCLIAHNYAIALDLEHRHADALELAQRGLEISRFYHEYQFLPGFLALQAECKYFLGEKSKSRELFLEAYYVYKAYGDENNQEIIRKNLVKYFAEESPSSR